jgi:hypothetical protein
MFEYRSRIPRYAGFWAFAALLAWAGTLALSLLFPHISSSEPLPLSTRTRSTFQLLQPL